jgi:hypothetical protein
MEIPGVPEILMLIICQNVGQSRNHIEGKVCIIA